ncbi:hypothetical protein ACFLY5_00765 [Patescibacteria group bacterium]
MIKTLEEKGYGEDMEKPPVMYHGTHKKEEGITELEPRGGRHRGRDEGKVLFATPDRVMASMFLAKGHNDNRTKIGKYNGTPVMVINEDRNEFIETDKGGTIHELPSDTFSCDKGTGLGELEWTSTKKVQPTGKTEYDSSLDAMIENGVQVFFVDAKTFEDIKSDKENHGVGILKDLESENQLTDKNFSPFWENWKYRQKKG